MNMYCANLGLLLDGDVPIMNLRFEAVIKNKYVILASVKEV